MATRLRIPDSEKKINRKGKGLVNRHGAEVDKDKQDVDGFESQKGLSTSKSSQLDKQKIQYPVKCDGKKYCDA